MRQVITTWHQRDYQEWYRRKIVCSPSIIMFAPERKRVHPNQGNGDSKSFYGKQVKT